MAARTRSSENDGDTCEPWNNQSAAGESVESQSAEAVLGASKLARPSCEKAGSGASAVLGRAGPWRGGALEGAERVGPWRGGARGALAGTGPWRGEAPACLRACVRGWASLGTRHVLLTLTGSLEPRREARERRSVGPRAPPSFAAAPVNGGRCLFLRGGCVPVTWRSEQSTKLVGQAAAGCLGVGTPGAGMGTDGALRAQPQSLLASGLSAWGWNPGPVSSSLEASLSRVGPGSAAGPSPVPRAAGRSRGSGSGLWGGSHSVPALHWPELERAGRGDSAPGVLRACGLAQPCGASVHLQTRCGHLSYGISSVCSNRPSFSCRARVDETLPAQGIGVGGGARAPPALWFSVEGQPTARAWARTPRGAGSGRPYPPVHTRREPAPCPAG